MVYVILLIAGFFGLWATHSLRPPKDMTDALFLMYDGRTIYLNEPYYYSLLAISFALVALSLFKIIKGYLNAPNR